MVQCGIDQIGKFDSLLKDARIGVVTCPTGFDKNLKPSYLVLAEKYNVTALFGPEHGIKGDLQAGVYVPPSVDADTGLTVYSLYGSTKTPTEEMMSNVDILVFDMQEVGARYYTILYTMTRAMQACAKYGKEMLVLDRPNPIGGVKTEGTSLAEGVRSFVGEYPVPVRYGLTIGEFALYVNQTQNIGCRLTVAPCDGWERGMYFEETGLPWVLPSPNLPSVNACLNFVATCYFEGTNISEGRGTTMPFELVGAPFLNGAELEKRMNAHNLPGVHFRRCFFTPTFEKHVGRRCCGVQLHITDREAYSPFDAGMYLLHEIRTIAEKSFSYTNCIWENGSRHLVLLYGHEEILSPDFNPAACIAAAKQSCERFEAEKKAYHIYY